MELLRGAALPHGVFTYDWRLDLAASARRLGLALDELAERCGDPSARFNIIGHSMGGLVARYYLRYGGAELEASRAVTWAGAERVRSLVLVATPSGGSVPTIGCHSTIDRPECVRRVMPPTTTITNTSAQHASSQSATARSSSAAGFSPRSCISPLAAPVDMG